MNALVSQYLNQHQLHVLERLGDMLLPGGYGFPAFAETGSLAHVDEILQATPEKDRQDLGVLLSVLRWMPDFILGWLLQLIDRRERLPELLAAPLRLLDLGLRGVLFSLYYSGLPGPFGQEERVHATMGYHLHCEPDPAENLS